MNKIICHESAPQSASPGADPAPFVVDFVPTSCCHLSRGGLAEYGSNPAVPPHRFVKLLAHEVVHVL